MTDENLNQNDESSTGKPSAKKTKSGRKLLENPVVGSLVVPIAIILVGGLIVFGVTAMLSTDRSHRDLVREMESKTFGNRWIAAYELSKLIATSSIPDAEIPWMVRRLNSLYSDSQDPRTRDFIIVSLGALKHEDALPTLEKVLADDDSGGNTHFHALVAVGNFPSGVDFNWEYVAKFLRSPDHGLRQAAVLTLATHRVEEYQEQLEAQLDSDFLGVRYAAAMGLIYFKSSKALQTLREILMRKPDTGPNAAFDAQELLGMQLNVIEALGQEEWPVLNDLLEKISENKENQQLALRARDVLNRLKN